MTQRPNLASDLFSVFQEIAMFATLNTHTHTHTHTHTAMLNSNNKLKCRVASQERYLTWYLPPKKQLKARVVCRAADIKKGWVQVGQEGWGHLSQKETLSLVAQAVIHSH